MQSGSFRFDRFVLEPANRLLSRDDAPVELNARYLDALALLVSEPGRLVSKDRFLDEVWRGVPVTDEALTQCIKTLRRLLGDDASRPRFIETVPKHGYRFIAPVERAGAVAPQSPASPIPGQDWRQFWLLGLAGTVGGGIAGVIGGLIYGFASASQPGTGAASVLLVLVSITVLVGLMGGAGVAFGISAASFIVRRPSPWSIVGGATGGLLVGAVVKLLGIDAFNLLVGQSPGDITGAAEGALLGAAVGLGAWLGSRRSASIPLRKSAAAAAAAGGAAAILAVALGGRLMAGSLDLLAGRFSDSRLRLDEIGGLFGEDRFGPVTHFVTAGLEGALFAGCVVGAMILAQRSLGERG